MGGAVSGEIKDLLRVSPHHPYQGAVRKSIISCNLLLCMAQHSVILKTETKVDRSKYMRLYDLIFTLLMYPLDI